MPDLRLHVHELSAPRPAPGPGFVYDAVVVHEGGEFGVGTGTRVRTTGAAEADVPGLFARLLAEHRTVRGAGELGFAAAPEFGVAAVSGAVDGGPVFWCATEARHGTTVARAGALGDERTVQVARDLCATLGALHGVGLPGVALSPERVIVTPDGRARLLDPGFAALDAAADLGRGAPWSPPEAVAGAERSHRGDLYGLGAVLFHCLSGEPPTGEVHVDASPFLAEVVEVLLDPDPRGRFLSARELFEVLAAGREGTWWRARCSQSASVAAVGPEPLRADPPPRATATPVASPDLDWLAARHAPRSVRRPRDERSSSVRGHADARAAVAAGVERLVAGEGGALAIVGPSGVGRTLLVDDAIAGLLGDDRVSVLSAAFRPPGFGRPLGALSAALTQFVSGGREVAAQELAPLLGPAASRAEAFAATVSGTDWPARVRPLSPEALSASFAETFRTLARLRPVLLVLDDVHYAETVERRLVDVLRGVASVSPLLVLETSTPALVAASEAVRPVFPPASIPLAPLEPANEVGALASRIGRAGDGARELLCAAALQGDRFDVDVARRALGWGRDRAAAAVRALESVALLGGEGPSRRFVVAAHAELVLKGLGSEETASLHRALATAFAAARNPDELPPKQLHGMLNARIAWHSFHGGDVAAGQPHLRRGMRHLRTTWRLDRAARLAAVAADRLRDDPASVGTVIDLHVERAGVLLRAGDRVGAQAALGEADASARRADDHVRRGRALLGLARAERDHDLAARLAKQAAEHAMRGGDRRTTAHCHHVRGLAYSALRRFVGARPELRRALEFAQAEQDPRLQARAGIALARVAAGAGWHDEARHHVDSAFIMIDALDDRVLEAELLVVHGELDSAARRLVPAEHRLRRAVAVARSMAEARHETRALIALVDVLAARGYGSEAHDVARQAERAASSLADRGLVAVARGARARTLLAVGDLDAAHDHADRAIAVLDGEPAGPSPRATSFAVLGEIARHRGNSDRALSLLERARAEFVAARDSRAEAAVEVALGRVAVWAGRDDAEERLRAALDGLDHSAALAVTHALRAVVAARAGQTAVVRARAEDVRHALRRTEATAARMEASHALAVAASLVGEHELAREHAADARRLLLRAERRLSPRDARLVRTARSPGREIATFEAPLDDSSQATRTETS